MSKARLSNSAMRFMVALAIAAGCSEGGLDQPTSLAPALELQVHLAEEPPAGATEILVGLSPIGYCPLTESFYGPQPPSPPLDWLRRPLDRTTPTMKVSVASAGDIRSFDCLSEGGLVPLVRFFQLNLMAVPTGDQGPLVPWTPHDTVIAYAAEPVTFTVFGPTDQPIELPVGYSVLRRSCGLGGASWQLQVGAPEATIDFFPPALPFWPQPIPSVSALLEQSERALLAGCGGQAPTPNLGTRVSFDRAASLSFTTDEQDLIFLLPIDSADPTQAAPVRSIHLADDSIRQLMIVPDGRNVQTAATGDIFIPTTTGVVRAHIGADGSVTSQKLPLSRSAVVSPNGKWISDWSRANDPPESATLWDVTAGIKRLLPVPGASLSLGFWSPTSQLMLAVFLTGQSDYTYDLLAPETGQMVRQFVLPPLGEGSGLPVVWGTAGPVELAATTSWRPQQAMTRQDRLWSSDGVTRDFGLVVQDFSSPSRAIQVFGAEGGLIQYATSAPGTALVWARKCLGLFETICSYDLHRISLPGGVDEIVAVSDTAAPVALSVTGKRLAIAARDGIYVRELR